MCDLVCPSAALQEMWELPLRKLLRISIPLW